MLSLSVKKSDVLKGYFDVSIGVDTGTTIVGVSPGLVSDWDLEVLLNDLQDQINTIRPTIK